MKEFALIKGGIEKLKKSDARFDFFGADSHRYQFNKKLSESEVREFEEKHEIKLPESYRSFLIELGNGGVGPFYGINKLEDSIPNQYSTDLSILKDEFPHSEEWNWPKGAFEVLNLFSEGGIDELGDYFHRKYLQTSEWEVPKEEWAGIKLLSGSINAEAANFLVDLFEQNYFSRKLDQGSITICNYGCGSDFRLIISGKERGNIWFDNRADEEGISPVRGKDNEKLDFHSWYMEWLNKRVQKYR